MFSGGVIGNCVCFSDHRAFSQLRDRLCGEAYDLGSSFADAENHIAESREKQILQYVNADSIILMYNNSRSLGST